MNHSKSIAVSKIESRNLFRPGYASQEEMWSAVKNRREIRDSSFVFAVRSTGIYCRPSCPARRPSRKNVVFFKDALDAEKNGYRPCMRCKPEKAMPQETEVVKKLCAYMERTVDRKHTLEKLSLVAGLSPSHLQRTFKKVTGISPRQYSDALKLRLIKSSIKNGKSVRESIYGAGYGSVSSLYPESEKKLGMQMSTYRNGGKGLQIYYSAASCSLGMVMTAGTEYGLCTVSLGDSEDSLLSILRHEYPNAEIQKNDDKLSEWLTEIVRYLDGDINASLSNLPLDIRMTLFQSRVWKELQNIPYGTTATYGEIADRISKPGAARAVARACASNPVALVIPCHRVVRNDDGPAGYRWGIHRKKILLEKEKYASSTVPDSESAEIR
ncbi:MAG: bifunctional DNA-binding transcriptional regulator/O6-methylguanine-DNA methyltransferase Ada [Thermoplasmatales archaeon]|nr:bifunctional DNA-binding transcriptional regulator/O6-methylguanine-DNA methyltransferase Ada [Thermoplasmatales archaeon]